VSDNGKQPLTDSEVVRITVLPNPPPVLQSVTVNNGGAQRSFVKRLVIQFSEDVSASLAANDLTLLNLTTGATIPSASLALAFNPAGNMATVTFTGLANQRLPDGNYRLTVTAAGVTGAHGKPMTADYTFGFHALAGDANGDRATNDLDLFEVWQNLLVPLDARNLNDDLNGDGQVTLADVSVVKANYKAVLPSPAPLKAASAGSNPTRPMNPVSIGSSLSVDKSQEFLSGLNEQGQLSMRGAYITPLRMMASLPELLETSRMLPFSSNSQDPASGERLSWYSSPL
jgi:hypothetical protein